MSKDKESGNFLRKVAKFVANPATDWAVLDSASAESRDSEYAKAEIKAMIERKRRNDFVRKRELDMLRRIRREGLSYDSALALSTPSNLDLESRPDFAMRSDIGVKAKIDAIEQQMVGNSEGARSLAQSMRNSMGLPPPSAPEEDTTPASLHLPVPLQGAWAESAVQGIHTSLTPPARSPTPADPAKPEAVGLDFDTADLPVSQTAVASASMNMVHAPPLPGRTVLQAVHDPELDEAVIAFANADFDACEASLVALIGEGGQREHSPDTWMTLFDLYRALDQPARFEVLGVNFAHRFGVSPPQWYCLPERVSLYMARLKRQGRASKWPSPEPATPPVAALGGDAVGDGQAVRPLEGWVAPSTLDGDSLASLRAELLQLPRPWVLDWTGVRHVTPEGASLLTQQLQAWAREDLAMSWVGTEPLLRLLEELAPTGHKDADPAWWMLRIELLRLCNRPDQFDEAAIDYCVTYERSPPSWESTRSKVRLLGAATHTQHASISHVGDISTNFVESVLHPDINLVQLASLDLSGQLVGDISTVLHELDTRLGDSVMIELDCAHLLRVDFIAAGDLLNWVLTRTSEHRRVTFLNPHRLVAAFFGAMGITEQAEVRLAQV